MLDGELVLDNVDAAPGTSFYGLGSEQTSVNVELVAGRDYVLVTEIHSTGLPLAGFELAAAPPAAGDLMKRAVEAAMRCDVAIVVVGSSGTSETEGADRTDLHLIGDQDELVRRVTAANPRTVVVLNVGAPVQTPWASSAAAVLNCWYPGEEGAPALARILAGDVDPGGRLPITFPVRIEDTPTYGAWYPGSEGRVTYGEGVFVGYRHFDARAIEPAFAFGHGLSYTTFEYGELHVSVAQRRVRVTLSVTNSGRRDGSDVVQLYVHEVSPRVERPEKELKAFEKVHLAAGASCDVCFDLEERAFSYWDESTHQWALASGEFEVLVAASSRDVRQRATFRVD
jgi:beta-glucosidase